MGEGPVSSRCIRMELGTMETVGMKKQMGEQSLARRELLHLDTAEERIEVRVEWGDSVMHVEHLVPDAPFRVGSEAGVDMLLADEVLGTSAAELLSAGRIQLPAGAILLSGGDAATVQPESIELGDSPIVFRLGEFTFRFSRVSGAIAAPAGAALDRAPLTYVGAVMTLAGIMLAIMSLVPPQGAALSIDNIHANSRLVSIISEAQEQFPPEPELGPTGGGDEGAAHEGETGEMGDLEAPESNNAYGIQGEAEREDRTLQREAATAETARTAGVLGVLAQMNFRNVPTSPFAPANAVGSDPMDALGHLMGDQLGVAQGAGGLGIIGTGHGAGGDGRGTLGLGEEGIGRGAFGRCDSSEGPCTGQGFGRGAGSFRERRAGVPRVRPAGNASIRGSLSRDVIRRVVRRHHNEIRHCYENGLQSRPDLAGRVSARFVISPSGSVTAASVANSSIGSQQVEQCIVSAVQRWSFPAPEGGIVSVTYPFMLQSR